MYSTAKPSCRTTEAASERVKKSGSSSASRRRAIAIERVRWPRPVPFELTNRIRSAEPLIGLQQGSRGVVPFPLELRQRPAVAPPERPGGPAASLFAPAPAPDLLGPEATLEE